MFKRFSVDDSISGQAPLKSSQQRAIRSQILEQMPALTPYIENIMPKKEKVLQAKCAGHVTIITSPTQEPLFFRERDGKFYPSLRLLHQYPMLLPVIRVDSGAVKHVMNGADVMVPGICKIEKETLGGLPCAVFADGKMHAMAVGKLVLSTNEIQKKKHGVGILNLHHLNDGLWKCEKLV